MAKAYNIVNIIKIHDTDKFQEYVNGHIPTIEKFGGRFLVEGYLGEVLEGSMPSNMMVVHEFPSIKRFKEWYYSEEYKPWKELRQSCADVNVILTEGK
ncbi:DUF1330 domain-containing protein [Sediminitomix flava]|uniref:Uncharacterized protein (DUF1330 family) n=1 Tax=Sediminitomix flava TaxID=379075 RepID=A0A315ZC00_SEDFL|nr:DUF1330 domain-containing protein [Sediminitomix flava]PWJ42318.1 uncharacterized protein (DUF1330 family) [Sediminitomix flava]